MPRAGFEPEPSAFGDANHSAIPPQCLIQSCKIEMQMMHYMCVVALQQLNWAMRPAKGDIQVNWRYEFPNGVPYGLKCRMLAICERCVIGHKYKHVWRDGVLFRIGEVCDLVWSGLVIAVCNTPTGPSYGLVGSVAWPCGVHFLRDPSEIAWFVV